MVNATADKPGRAQPETITWGDPEEVGNSDLLKTLRGWEFKYGSAPQSLPGYRVGVATDRAAQEGAIKAVLGDQSMGVKPRAGIGYWQSDALRSHVRNEGWQTRAGMPSLPYVQQTQVAISSAADPTTYNSTNKRRHELSSSLGGSVFRYYCGLAANFLRNDNSGATKSLKSELETASCNVDGAGSSVTLPGVVTAIAHLHVNRARVLALALEDYGVVYTADPTASPVVFTTLVELSSGDRIDGMAFMEELGPIGTNIFSGQVGGINSAAWWADASMTASTQLQQVSSVTGASSYATYTRQVTAESFFTVAGGYDPDNGMGNLGYLLGWWPMSEASGNALDVSGANRDLTDNNTVAAAAAVGNIDFRDFESVSTEYFTTADAAWNSVTGALDIHCWVNIESVGADRVIVAKWDTTSDQRSYRLYYDNAANRFVFQVSSSGTAGTVTSVTASNFGAPSVATLYFIRAYHDPVNNIISIAVNNGTANTAAHSTDIFDSTAAFRIGNDSNGNLFDGLIGAVSLWGEVRSAAQVTAYYGGGSGLAATTVFADAGWGDGRNALANDGSNAVSDSLTAGNRTMYFRFASPSISGPDASDRILGIAINIEHSSTNDMISLYSIHYALSGVQVGVTRYPESDLPGADVLGGPNDTMFAELTGADLANLEVWLQYVGRDTADAVSIDYASITVYYSADAPQRLYLANQVAVGVDKDTSGTPTATWESPGAVLADDSSSATITGVASSQSDFLLYGPLIPAGALPSEARLLGLQFDLIDIDGGGSLLGDDTTDETVQLYRAGSLIGLNKAKDSAYPDWGADVRNRSYGRDGDAWAAGLDSPGDLAEVYLAIRIDIDDVSASLGHIRYHLSYIVPGAAPSLPLGGWCPGASPDESNTIYRAVPPVDEPDTVVQPRTAKKLVFTWDTESSRPLLTLTRVSVGMSHVEHFNYALGGILATGDHAGGPGRHLHLISRTGAVYDQNFAGLHGTAEVRVNAIGHVQGLHSVLDIVDSDYSNRQFWTLRDQSYFADWIMQSKSERTITERPIACAETAIDLENDRMYSLFPKSNGLAASRVFCPRDLNADPRLTSTDEVRSMAWSGNDGSRTEAAALYLYMGVIDFGPPEAAKAVTMVSHHSYRVDDATLYGTTKFEATTDGSVPDGSDAFDLTFAAGLSDQTNYAFDQAIAGAQDYRTLYIRLGGTHTAATAKSPDLGPFLMTTNQMWLDDELIHVIVDRSHINEADSEFLGFDDWREFAWKKPTRTLTLSSRQVLAQWVGWREGDQWASLPALGSSPGEGPPLIAVWRRVPGEVDPAS